MARYIDVDVLEKEGWYMARVYNDSLTSQTYETKKIKEFPTADVVEVVRCRDCEMFKLQDLSYPKHNTKWCVINGFNPQGGDYCSYGERKSE